MCAIENASQNELNYTLPVMIFHGVVFWGDLYLCQGCHQSFATDDLT